MWFLAASQKKSRPEVPLQRLRHGGQVRTVVYGRIAQKINPENHDTKYQPTKSPDYRGCDGGY